MCDMCDMCDSAAHQCFKLVYFAWLPLGGSCGFYSHRQSGKHTQGAARRKQVCLMVLAKTGRHVGGEVEGGRQEDSCIFNGLPLGPSCFR